MKITTRRQIIQYFENLPPDQIDPSGAVYEYEDRRACCIGAHLAHLFQVPVPSEEIAEYLAGADALARWMGGTRAHMIVMLQQCGVGNNDPFVRDAWDTPPDIVFPRLLDRKSLPSLVGADLRKANLRKADLRKIDLSEANLHRAGQGICSKSPSPLRGLPNTWPEPMPWPAGWGAPGPI